MNRKKQIKRTPTDFAVNLESNSVKYREDILQDSTVFISVYQMIFFGVMITLGLIGGVL